MPDTAQAQTTETQVNSAKQEIFDYVKTRLGDGMIEVELDPKHLENAFVTSIFKDFRYFATTPRCVFKSKRGREKNMNW